MPIRRPTIAQVAAWLAANCEAPVVELRLLDGGFENLTVAARLPPIEADVVFRVSTRRTMLEVSDELAFINLLADRGVHVARPVPVLSGRAVAESHLGIVAAFEHVPGVHLDQAGQRQAARVASEVLHLTDAAAGWTVAGARGRRGFSARVHTDLDRWLPPELLRSERAELHTLVERLYDSTKPDRLVHGDVHPGNVLWTGRDDDRCPHIIDFDDCFAGCREDELYACVRGWCFDWLQVSRPRLDVITEAFGLDTTRAEFWGRLAAECAYFLAALLDSAERAGISPPTEEHLVDLARAVTCLRRT